MYIIKVPVEIYYFHRGRSPGFVGGIGEDNADGHTICMLSEDIVFKRVGTDLQISNLKASAWLLDTEAMSRR